MQIKSYLSDLFKNDVFFYFAMDVKRALGLHDILPNFHIMTTSYDPLIAQLRKQNISVFCLEEEMGDAKILPRSAGQLLAHHKAQAFIKSKSTNPRYLSFKPALGFDTIDSGQYLGNRRTLNEKYEDKVNFYTLLKSNFEKNTIPSVVGKLGELHYSEITKLHGNRCVIQFGKGWAGNTTFFIENEEEFETLKNKFTETTVRVSKRILGETLLNNCCIYRGNALQSRPAVQISGIDWLNPNPTATAGRQWGGNIISQEIESEIAQVTKKIGEMLAKDNYKGYFGIDFIVEENTNTVYISELNARFTASSPFYTKLEIGANKIPLYAYHLAEFLGKTINWNESEEIIEGCEVSGEYKGKSKLRSGRYMIKDSQMYFADECLDVSELKSKEDLILLSDETKWKIQTNYPILKPEKEFRDEFENGLKSLSLE